MEKTLSVIIPFLNEGEEIYNTLDSLFSTIDEKEIEVIVINDCSDGNYDLISKYNVKYIINERRLGVAESRNAGVSVASSKSAIFFDSHMRFPYGWSSRVIEEVSKDPESIFCCACSSLDSEHSNLLEAISVAYGASLSLFDGKGGILEPKWITLKRNEDVYDVQCVLGASYAFNVNKFKSLMGLNGLISWGGDEQYLSLKYWLSGGSCKIISDVTIGHFFRSNKPPYSIPPSHIIYNKIFICTVIMPDDIALRIIEKIPQDENLAEAAMMFRRNMKQIFEYKKYYKSVFTRSFPQVCEMLDINVP